MLRAHTHAMASACLVLAGCLLMISGCTSLIARKHLPYPLTNEHFRDPVKVVTIPLPAIAATPNEGVTYGALTAFLLHNRKDEADTLIAPQLYYNANFGVTGALYGSFYLTPERSWEINLSRSSKINEDYELKLRDKTLLGKKLELGAFLFAFTDGSARFFGFGPESSKSDETNFGDREIGFALSVGYDIAEHLQLAFRERYRKVGIVEGAVVSLPFIRDSFSAAEVPGIDGFATHAQALALVYDSRDSREFPRRGLYARAAVEASLRLLGSSADFRKYEIEGKGYFPWREARFLTIARFAYIQTSGGNTPFLEQSILGGETTLRGYGRYRFIDSASLLFNLEERIRLFRWRIFNVNSVWEVAPFLDIGTVMGSLSEIRGGDFEYNPGIGFRAAVRPNIVGRIDVGFGKEGPAVFVGLGYPF